MENHLLRDPETIKKKYQIVFKIWAKKKKKGPTRPPYILPSIRQCQKFADTGCKLKVKKKFLGLDIKEKETQMRPHRRTTYVGPPPGDKKFRGSKMSIYRP